MANYNTIIKKRRGSEWDNIYPMTTAENVMLDSSTNAKNKFERLDTAITTEINERKESDIDLSNKITEEVIKISDIITGLSGDISEIDLKYDGITDVLNVNYEEINKTISQKFNLSVITPEMYGAKGDGVTDDTLAVQKAFDNGGGKKIVFNGNYSVNQIIVTTGPNSVIDFNGYKLIARSTSNLDSVLLIQSSFNTWFNVFVDVQYKENYYCGIRLKPRLVGSTVTHTPQYNNFFGVTVSSSIWGVIYGENEGVESIKGTASSENVFYGLKGYSLNKGFYVNQHGSYFTMVGCTFETNRGGWASVTNPTRYNDEQSCCFRCDVGAVNIVASEICKADTTGGYGIYGRGMNFNNCTWEVGGVQGYITGTVSIRNSVDGYIGNGDKPYFIIKDDTIGDLIIENCVFRRPLDAEAFVNNVLFTGEAPFFTVKLTNVIFTHTMFNNQFIKGLNYELNGVKYSPSGRFGEESDDVLNKNDKFQMYFNNQNQLNLVDISKQLTQLPTTLTKDRIGDIIVFNDNGTNNSEGVKRISGDLPQNCDVEYIGEFIGNNGWSGIRTPYIKVEPNECFSFSVIGKSVGSSVSTLSVITYNEDRNISDVIYSENILIDRYRRYNGFIKVPSGVKYIMVRIINNMGQITRFTDFKVIGVKHDKTEYKDSIPNVGYWDKGQIVYNKNPMEESYIGWVCVNEPNTFKPFGKIGEVVV